MLGLLLLESGVEVLPLIEPVVLCSLEVELPTLPVELLPISGVEALLLALFGEVLLEDVLLDWSLDFGVSSDFGVWSFTDPVLP